MVEIEIGGKKRRFSFGLEVLGWVQIASGIDITNPKHNMSGMNLFYVLIKPLIFYGNKAELLEEGKDVDYTLKDVDEWIKEKGITHKDIVKIWTAFNESVYSYLPKTDDKNEDAPKKK